MSFGLSLKILNLIIKSVLKIDIKIGQNFEGSALVITIHLKKDLYFENSSEKTT